MSWSVKTQLRLKRAKMVFNFTKKIMLMLLLQAGGGRHTSLLVVLV